MICCEKSGFFLLVYGSHYVSVTPFRYGHMIDNVVLIVTGTLHERDVQELLEKCHPLGMFDRYCHPISVHSVIYPRKMLSKCYAVSSLLVRL